MFESVDCDTTGPASFSDKICKKLIHCEKIPVANFNTINSEVIKVHKTGLSKAQQYLLDIYRTLKTEECEPDLAVKDPDLLTNSRLLNCANKILRLYISEVKLFAGQLYHENIFSSMV